MKKAVLLVDDDELVINATKNTLERLGYIVHFETDAADAVQVFARDPWRFDLVITDHNMPGLSGFIVSERLLEMRPDVPIVLMAGTNDIDKERAEAIGIRAFITKPVSRAELAESIAEALRTTNQ